MTIGGASWYYRLPSSWVMLTRLNRRTVVQQRVRNSVAPILRGKEDLTKRQAERGQLIDDARWGFGKSHARHQSKFLKATQTMGKRVGADPRQSVAQLGETTLAS